MVPSRVKAGTSFTAYTDFIDEYGKPIPPLEPVKFTLRDADNDLILEGTASQSPQPERWQTNISIPEQVQAGTCTLTWVLKSKDNRDTQRETFEIVDQTPNYYEMDQLLPEKSVVTDALKVDRTDDVTDASVTIVTPDGKTIYTGAVVAEPVVTGSKKYIQFKSAGPVEDLIAGYDVTAMYIIVWDFVLNGEQQKEYHFAYVVNYKILPLIRELKRMIDKANIQHPNPSLRYNEVDLLASLNLGLQWLNAQPPTQTAWTLNDFPNTMYSYLLNAGAWEAVNSRLHAESEAAFSFNGQPITLDVDRTGFLESALSRYETRLQGITPAKKTLVMSGGGYGSASGGSGGAGGILSYSAGPTLTLSPYGFNSRSPYYQSWVDSNTGYTNLY